MQGWIHVGIEVDRCFIRVSLFMGILGGRLHWLIVCDHFRWVFLYTLDVDVHIWEMFIGLGLFPGLTSVLRARPACGRTICFGYDNLLGNKGSIENTLIEYVLRIHSFQCLAATRRA